MTYGAWIVLALITGIVCMTAYNMFDRWCDHKEEMRGKK